MQAWTSGSVGFNDLIDLNISITHTVALIKAPCCDRPPPPADVFGGSPCFPIIKKKNCPGGLNIKAPSLYKRSRRVGFRSRCLKVEWSSTLLRRNSGNDQQKWVLTEEYRMRRRQREKKTVCVVVVWEQQHKRTFKGCPDTILFFRYCTDFCFEYQQTPISIWYSTLQMRHDLYYGVES